MATALPTSGFRGIAQRFLQKRRPLAPLAISRPDGTTGAVPAPTQSRVPQGTIFSRIQQMRGGSVPTSSVLRTMQQRAPSPAVPRPAPMAAPAPAPAAAPAPRAPAPISGPNIAPAAQPGQSFAGGTPNFNEAAGGGLITDMRFKGNAPPVLRPMIQPPVLQGGQPGQFGEEVRDIQGTERPQQILPGQSATQPLQERAQAEAMRALENPSPYDDDLFKQEVERARQSFGADIAERGLDYSSIAPQEFSRTVLNPLLSERARGISEARQRASETARGVIGQRAGLEAEGRGELRGERGYTDELRERARRNEIERYQLGEGQFQQTLQQAFASGDPSRALAALQGAAYGMGGPAAAYGEQAEQSGAGLQELAQQFMQQFYGNRGGQ